MAFNYPIGSGGRPAPKKAAAAPVAEHEEPDGDEGMDSADPHEVVQEHGPAAEVTVTHDHEGGKHSVHSRHGDGHEHHAEHASAAEAHQHATCLGGECGCGGM